MKVYDGTTKKHWDEINPGEFFRYIDGSICNDGVNATWFMKTTEVNTNYGSFNAVCFKNCEKCEDKETCSERYEEAIWFIADENEVYEVCDSVVDWDDNFVDGHGNISLKGQYKYFEDIPIGDGVLVSNNARDINGVPWNKSFTMGIKIEEVQIDGIKFNAVTANANGGEYIWYDDATSVMTCGVMLYTCKPIFCKRYN